MIKKLLALAVVVVIAAGGAFYWFVLRDKPAAKLSVTAPSSGTKSSTSIADAGQAVPVDGTWNVSAGGDNAVGLRIEETFVGGVAKHTAVGRTRTVTGSIAISGTKVTTGRFTADLTAIEFTDSPPGLDVANRKRAISRAGLETSTYPTGSFKLTKPIDLGTVPKAGVVITTTATGDLTLHGTTKSVTFKVQARIVNGSIVIATADPVPVVLADYKMTPPAFGPVADVSKTGSFEFRLTLTKA